MTFCVSFPFKHVVWVCWLRRLWFHRSCLFAICAPPFTFDADNVCMYSSPSVFLRRTTTANYTAPAFPGTMKNATQLRSHVFPSHACSLVADALSSLSLHLLVRAHCVFPLCLPSTATRSLPERKTYRAKNFC